MERGHGISKMSAFDSGLSIAITTAEVVMFRYLLLGSLILGLGMTPSWAQRRGGGMGGAMGGGMRGGFGPGAMQGGMNGPRGGMIGGGPGGGNQGYGNGVGMQGSTQRQQHQNRQQKQNRKSKHGRQNSGNTSPAPVN